jgi:hypothetical protein
MLVVQCPDETTADARLTISCTGLPGDLMSGKSNIPAPVLLPAALHGHCQCDVSAGDHEAASRAAESRPSSTASDGATSGSRRAARLVETASPCDSEFSEQCQRAPHGRKILLILSGLVSELRPQGL